VAPSIAACRANWAASSSTLGAPPFRWGIWGALQEGDVLTPQQRTGRKPRRTPSAACQKSLKGCPGFPRAARERRARAARPSGRAGEGGTRRALPDGGRGSPLRKSKLVPPRLVS
jgi:hypothetical protein